MLHIAICDDEPIQLQQMESFLNDYFTENQEVPAKVMTFTSGSALLAHVQKEGSFDIYLLDVLMPVCDGIELGMTLRSQDEAAVIIYLTSSPDFAVDSYLTKAFHYLLKPVEKDRLFHVIQDAVSHIKKAEASLPLKTKDGFFRIPLSKITHAELVGRCIRYHLSDTSYVDGMTLRCSFSVAVTPLLQDPRFLLCGTSFAVNLDYVDRIERTELFLSNGQRLPLPRNCRANVMNRWMDYYLNGEDTLC